MYNLFGTVIDKQGYKVEFVALNEDKSPQFYELKEGEAIVEEDWQIANSMNKPQWVNDKWIDTDPLPPIVTEPQEPDEMEVLKARVDGLENINAGLLLENAEHQIKIQEQEKMNKEQEVTNANLLLEIAMLKGAML